MRHAEAGQPASTTDWDVTTGVGVTALGVAAARAAETSRSEAVCHDPYAAALVAAADAPAWWPTSAAAAREQGWDGELAQVWEAMVAHMGVRTRCFDDFLTDAVAAGLGQVVILALAAAARLGGDHELGAHRRGPVSRRLHGPALMANRQHPGLLVSASYEHPSAPHDGNHR